MHNPNQTPHPSRTSLRLFLTDGIGIVTKINRPNDDIVTTASLSLSRKKGWPRALNRSNNHDIPSGLDQSHGSEFGIKFIIASGQTFTDF
jgi:hypothetical protein